MSDKKNILERQFFIYGFLPFVYLLNELEAECRFEECQIIYEIIKEKSSKHELNLPTKYSEEAVKYFLEAFGDAPNRGRLALHNVPFYAAALRGSIENL